MVTWGVEFNPISQVEQVTMINTGRQEDIMELYRMLERESDPDRRNSIKRTIQAIKGETGAIRSMREALVKAHRNGDREEIKDIHSFIAGKEKYRSDQQI